MTTVTFDSKGIDIKDEKFKNYKLSDKLWDNRIEELVFDNPIGKEYNILYNIIEGSDIVKLRELKENGYNFDGLSENEWLARENKKSNQVSPNLYAEITKRLGGENEKGESLKFSEGNKIYKTILATDSKENIEKNLKDNAEKLKHQEELLTKMRQLKKQRDATGNEQGGDYNDPFKDRNKEDLNERAKGLEAYRNKVKGEIETALNENPKVTNEELEAGNRGWEQEIWNSHLALGTKEVDEIKNRILADIKAKRAAKNNERPTTPNQPSPIVPKTDSDRKVYNTSFQAENNETVRKFWELRGLIYDKPESWEKFSQVNFALLEKVDKAAIEAERGEFRTVWSKDSEEKKQEVNEFNKKKLTKMGEAIKLIEQLIAESKKGNKNTEAKSRNKKRKAEVDIRQERIKKNRTVANELNQLITEAAGKNTYEELELILQKIEKYEEEEEFYYNKREKAEEIKKQLSVLDADKYKKRVVEKLEKKLKDISEELKKKLTQIKNGEVADIDKISEIETKIIEESGEKVATGTLASWIKKAENLVEGTIKQVKKDFEEVKKGLLSFSFSTKVYERRAYETQQKKVEEMLTKLENYSDENTNNSSLLRKEVVIPAVLITGLLVAVISIVIIRNKKRARKLEKIED